MTYTTRPNHVLQRTQRERLNETLSQKLLALAKADLSVRDELVADGSLASHRYHPRMEAVHKDNAARLEAILEQLG